MEDKALTGQLRSRHRPDMTLQQAVFAGLVDPGNLGASAAIVTEPTTPGTLDTAVFSGPRANYTITPNADGSLTVVDNVGADGTDTLRSIENLRFTDGDVSVAPPATLTAMTNGDVRQPAGRHAPARPGRSRSRTAACGTLTFTAGDPVHVHRPGRGELPHRCDHLRRDARPRGGSCTVLVTFKPRPPRRPAAKSATPGRDEQSRRDRSTFALTGTATGRAGATAADRHADGDAVDRSRFRPTRS